MKKFLFYSILILNLISILSFAQSKIDLHGKWQFAIDSLDKGIEEKWFVQSYSETLNLPGSLTENGIGNKVNLSTNWTGDIIDSTFFYSAEYEKYRRPENFKVPFWLQPDVYYCGVAWYQREIIVPSDWHDKLIVLFFERCHWQSTLWIDGNLIGNQNALGAPHKYDIGNLTPGKHAITVRIDNRINDINPGKNSHSISDHTQTNWNGIVGEMCLIAKDRIHFGNVRIFTDIKSKKLNVEASISNLTTANQKIELTLQAYREEISPCDQRINEFKKEVDLTIGENTLDIEYDMGENALLWNEFSPNLYTLSLKLSSENFEDIKKETFGLRELSVDKTQFRINGQLTFLRGTLECAIFPKTGYPPVDLTEWKRIFTQCKNFGLNHVRFHSWCPPEAAFVAADQAGIYLQVECSSWANQGSSLGDGQPIDKYIYDESERIVNEFGNHPSFCFMLYGNEPAGSNQQKYLGEYVNYWKEKDKRRLYSSGAGWPMISENDFYSSYEPRIQLWGQGLNSIINSQSPCSNYDWENIINAKDKPIISHEIGQWCVYPNFDEIKKYDGVLHARNFEIFKDIITNNGMMELADDFLFASGKLQTLCYKAEIEAALRTKGMGGFQLLDLHDFPGQGTALVGVLDPFWDEKGYVSSTEYSQFCNSTVPLANFSKFIFTSAEDLTCSLEIAHFGTEPFSAATPQWRIIDCKGIQIAEGKLTTVNIPIGNGIQLGGIRFPLVNLKSPAMYSLEVSVNQFTNKWDFWVYPANNELSINNTEIRIVRELDDQAINFINNGGKVIISPVKGSIKPEKGGNIAVGFSSIFWNTAWTSKQPPHTLGILCNPEHPLLKEFPTQSFSNYQWWDAMSHSSAILLNELGDNIQPVVRIIDDWFTARPLGLIIEAKVGKGKIILTSIDLLTDIEKRPEAKQLTKSIIDYMKSESFAPTQEISIKKIIELINTNN
ncbi:MAG: sugar-binding domain-containing protein [bacterium]